MLIETSSKLAKNSDLNVYFNCSLINVTTSYTYLGIEIDHHLNIMNHLTKLTSLCQADSICFKETAAKSYIQGSKLCIPIYGGTYFLF